MSCLFISIGRLVNKPHRTVRSDICNHMEQHLQHTHQGIALCDWIKWQGMSPYPRVYIQNMRNPATWGGAMELAVATQVYGVDIVVVNGWNETLAEFKWHEDCTARQTLYLQWTGAHYEPLRVCTLR